VTDESVFGRIRARGSEVFQQITSELMSNEHFVKAVQGAARGKETLDKAVSRAMKTLNVPTRAEFLKMQSRLSELEEEIESLRSAKKSPARRTRKGK
jgi:hypothetical protein